MPSNTEATGNTASTLAIGIERMAWSRQFLMGLLAGLEGEHLTARAGGRGNHALWIMGHVAMLDDNIATMITGEPATLPGDTSSLFGFNSEPSGDTTGYPAPDELIDRMAACRDRVVSAFETLDDAGLVTPMPDDFQMFAPDRLTLPFAISGHEMIHAGQLTAIRAYLGLPRMLA